MKSDIESDIPFFLNHFLDQCLSFRQMKSMLPLYQLTYVTLTFMFYDYYVNIESTS